MQQLISISQDCRQDDSVVKVLVTQSCLIPCNLMDCSPPGSSVHGTSQARILEWVATSSCRGSSWPRDRNHVSCLSCIGRRHWATWEAHTEDKDNTNILELIDTKIWTPIQTATGDVKLFFLCCSLLPSYCLIIQLQKGRLLNFILW